MGINKQIVLGLLTPSLLAWANANLGANSDRFALSGHYHEESTGMDISIDDNRRMMISNVSWDYPDPLMSGPGAGYHSTGYYPDTGCKVPIRTIIEFDEADKTLFVEFHKPTMIISGALGCQFPGDKTEFHQLAVSSSGNQNWQRVMEGRGCGSGNAKADLQKQIDAYTAQCTSEAGTSSTQLDPRPMCWAPDPNDIQCPSGRCWWHGQFFCKK